jgi:hypothetical protein
MQTKSLRRTSLTYFNEELYLTFSRKHTKPATVRANHKNYAERTFEINNEGRERE